MEFDSKHQHFKVKIAVSGAAETGHCGGENVLEMAKELGAEIVRHDAILVNGATTGFPLWAARGAKEEGGTTIGISPAANEEEHVALYKLPLDYLDLIIYTGSGYAARNILLTRSADAVIVGCGRIGTIHEFTTAFEDRKPLGVLEGSWPTDDIIKSMIDNAHRPNNKVIFDKDIKNLVARLIVLVKEEKKEGYGVYAGGGQFHRECKGPDCKVIL